MPLPRIIWLIPLVASAAAPAPAQTIADSGAFIIRLGHDTLGVER